MSSNQMERLRRTAVDLRRENEGGLIDPLIARAGLLAGGTEPRSVDSIRAGDPGLRLRKRAGQTTRRLGHRQGGRSEELLRSAPASVLAPKQAYHCKRALDLFCIVLSLPMWLPVMILISLWVKLVSPGPVFFRQARVGRGGSRFMMFKFRSMKCGAETRSHEQHVQQLIRSGRPMTKLDSAGDPRLIPGARLIRALGLDELPQLFNVLSGEMSLVGPRPCTAHEFEHFEEWQRARTTIRPGLTGYWQVNGKNSTTFQQMIEMDLFYARNMSLKLDLNVLTKTFPALLGQALRSRSKSGSPLSKEG